MKRIVFMIICVIAVMLISCNDSNKFKNDVVRLSLNDSVSFEQSHCFFDVKVVFASGNDAVSNLINDSLCACYFGIVGKKPAVAMNEWRDSLAANYRQEMMNMKDFTDDGFIPVDYSFTITGTELESVQGIRSFSAFFMDYMGGAHPNHITIIKHFDTATGKTLTINDILGKSAEAALPTLQKKMAEKLGCTVDQLEERGLWAAADWIPTEQFILSADSVTFLFNPYEAGCYAVGDVHITVARKDI